MSEIVSDCSFKLFPQPVMSSPDEQPPKWLESLLDKQSHKIASLLVQQLKPNNPSGSGLQTTPKKSSPPRVETEDEEFDRRFVKFIGLNVNKDDSDNVDAQDCNSDNLSVSDENENYLHDNEYLLNDEDDDNVSVDNDLVEINAKEINWDVSSSIENYVSTNADKQLSDELIRQLSEDFVPKDDLQPFFNPQKMPQRLLRIITRMSSKSAIKTEKGLFAAQNQLLTIAKPLISALIELKPLGPNVSKARELMSVTLGGIFSVNLAIARARRDNVRFLFKNSLADVLFTYDPTHISLFGGTSFASQLEKASKEAKLDLSWSKKPDTKQPFRGHQGFYSQRGASRFLGRRQSRFRPYGGNNNSSYNNYKKGSGSKRTSGQQKKSSFQKE